MLNKNAYTMTLHNLKPIQVVLHLEELEIIEWIGTNTNDPKKRYILKR